MPQDPSLATLNAQTVGVQDSQPAFLASPDATAQASTRAHHLTAEDSHGSNLPSWVDEVKVTINNTNEYFEVRPEGPAPIKDLVPSPSDRPAPINPSASTSLYEHVRGTPDSEWHKIGATMNYSHINKGQVEFNFHGDGQYFNMNFSGT